jgi:hypothetical protein
MTISAPTILRAKELIRRGLSARKIERILDGLVCRTTITKIAAGTYHPKRPNDPETNEPTPEIVYTKCPVCHYRVTLPCQICKARFYRHQKHLRRIRRKAARAKRP